MPQDYNQTLNLPNTEFPMRAGLPVREPEALASWYEEKLYEEILARNEGKEVPAIPLSAIINDGKRDFVYVVGEGNKVVRRAVVTGELQRDLQVVKSGLAIGETVVVEGVHKIYPGATVVPVPLAAGKK